MIGAIEIIAVGIIYLIVWCVAFVSLLKSEFRGNEKIVWLMALIFVPILGLVCYLGFGRKQKVE